MKKKDGDKNLDINGRMTDHKSQYIKTIDPDLIRNFLIEIKDHLEKIETGLFNLKTDPQNTNTINLLYQEFHTIKGLAGFVNHELIQKIAQHVKTLLSSFRQGKSVINPEVIDLVYNCSDYIRRFFEDISLNDNPEFLHEVEACLERITVLTAGFQSNESPSTRGAEKNKLPKASALTMASSAPPGLSEPGYQAGQPIINAGAELPLKMIWIDRSFFQEIIARILEWVTKIEMKLLVMKANHEDTSLCLKNRRFFQMINRLAELVEADLIGEIARQTVVVLNKCDKDELKITPATIDWLLTSVNYIKMLCDDFTLNYDQDFFASAKEHLNRFPVNDQELAKVDVFDDAQIKRLGDILVEQKKLTQEELAELLAKQKVDDKKLRLGQIAMSAEKIRPAELVESLKIQKDSIILSISDQENEYDTTSFLKKIPGGKKEPGNSSKERLMNPRKKPRSKPGTKSSIFDR